MIDGPMDPDHICLDCETVSARADRC